MPYKKYTCFQDGVKKYCTKNLKTGQVIHYSSPEKRDIGIKIREAFAHGFKPTRQRPSSHFRNVRGIPK